MGVRMKSLWIGLGEVGVGMIPFFRALPDFQIVALADPRDASLDHAAAALGEGVAAVVDVARFADWRDAIRQAPALGVGAVVINTPGHLHDQPVRAALEARLHVLVAKPFVPTIGQAIDLVKLAEAQDRTLCVAQQMRYHRHAIAIRDALASGLIGRPEVIHFVNAKPRPDPLNLAAELQPALREMSCHHFDTLLSLLPGRRAARVFVDAFRPSWSPYAGPCTVNATLACDDGTRVLYHAGFSARASCYELRFEGSEGALRARGVHMSNDDVHFEHARPGGPWQSIDLMAGTAHRSPWREFASRWHAYVTGAGGIADGRVERRDGGLT
jgi:predicted dehydrogenase